jgi:hypothetical protein
MQQTSAEIRSHARSGPLPLEKKKVARPITAPSTRSDTDGLANTRGAMGIFVTYKY